MWSLVAKHGGYYMQKITIEIQRNKKQQHVAYSSDFHRGFQAINANFQITDLPN